MAGFSMITSTITCALLVVFSVCYLPPPAASLVFNYTFSNEDQKDIRLEGDASSSVGWIDISANRITGIGGSSGRASYAHPVPLWDSTTGEVARFTTRFSFVIHPTDINNKGNGMAFFLAVYPSSLPPTGSSGYNLGLTNQSAGDVASGNSRFVAVEFDTFNDTIVSDPNTTYDHIGIDVNSLISVNTSSLPNFSLSGRMNATIEYDNVSSILAMTLWLGDGRDENYSLSSKVDLKSALPEQVAVGFSASTGASMELHQLFSWYFNSSLEPKAAPPPPPPSPSGSGRHGVIAGATTVLEIILF